MWTNPLILKPLAEEHCRDSDLICIVFYSPRSRRSHQHYHSQYPPGPGDFDALSERQRLYHQSQMRQHQATAAAAAAAHSNIPQSVLSQHPHLFNAATSNHIQQAAAAQQQQSNAAAAMNTPHQPRPFLLDLSQIRQVKLRSMETLWW